MAFTNFDISTLTTSTGLVLTGASGMSFGTSVAGLGDVNGDSFPDLIIGDSSSNKAYVVFGRNGGFAASLDATTLVPISCGTACGFIIQSSTGTSFGASVSGIGDINNDGKPDFIVGDNGALVAYVIFGIGNGSTFASPFDVNSPALSGTNGGFTITCSTGCSNFGISVSGGMDINDDGISDLIVGDGTSGGGGTKAYVIYGSTNTFSNVEATTLNGNNGFIIRGSSTGDFGIGVTQLGDVNSDGITDLMVGDYANPIHSAYIVFGQHGMLTNNLDVTTFTGTNGGFIVTGIPSGDFGQPVSNLGDVNGDSIADLIIGDGYTNYLYAYVVFGKTSGSTFSSPLDATALTGSNGGFIIYDSSCTNFATKCASSTGVGAAVSGLYDINADTISDLIVGSTNNNAYIIFGQSGSFSNVDVSSLTGTNGGFIVSSSSGSSFGSAVGKIIDINNDGASDCVIGDPGLSKAYVIFGIPCLAGTYLDSGLCTPCPVGTYSSIAGQSSCITAANGGFTNTQTGATTYTQCPAGYYNAGVGYGASYSVATACTAAPVGVTSTIRFLGTVANQAITINSGGVYVANSITNSSFSIQLPPSTVFTISIENNFDGVSINSSIGENSTVEMSAYNMVGITHNASMGENSILNISAYNNVSSCLLNVIANQANVQISAPSIGQNTIVANTTGGTMTISSANMNNNTAYISPAGTDIQFASSSMVNNSIILGCCGILSCGFTLAALLASTDLTTLSTLGLNTLSQYCPEDNSLRESVSTKKTIMTVELNSPSLSSYSFSGGPNVQITAIGQSITQEYTLFPDPNFISSITIFNRTGDVIDLRAFAPGINTFDDLIITQGSAVVNLPSEQKIIVENLYPRDLSANNFIFEGSSSLPITLEPEYIAHDSLSESGLLGITLGVTAGITLGMAAVVGMSVISIAGILGCRHTHDKALYAPETFAPNLNMPTIGDVAMILDHAH